MTNFPKTYRLIQDEDGHWYIIEWKDIQDFEEWVEWAGDDSMPYVGPGYDKCRIDGPHTVIITEYEICKNGV